MEPQLSHNCPTAVPAKQDWQNARRKESTGKRQKRLIAAVEAKLALGVIEDIDGFPMSEQRITFEGQQLADGHTLADYNIQEDSTLYMLKRLQIGLPWQDSSDRRVRPRLEWTGEPSINLDASERRSQPNCEVMYRYAWSARHNEFYYQCTCGAAWGCFPTTEECREATGAVEVAFHLGGQRQQAAGPFVCNACKVCWW